MARRHHQRVARFVVVVTTPRFGARDELVGLTSRVVYSSRSRHRAERRAAEIGARLNIDDGQVDVARCHLTDHGRWALAPESAPSPHRVAFRRAVGAHEAPF